MTRRKPDPAVVRMEALSPERLVLETGDLARYYEDGWHYARVVEIGRKWCRLKHPVPRRVTREDGSTALADRIIRREVKDVEKVFTECPVHRVLFSKWCDKCTPNFKRRKQ